VTYRRRTHSRSQRFGGHTKHKFYCSCGRQVSGNGGKQHFRLEGHTRVSQRLAINPEPLAVVPDAQRDVWVRQQGFRCDHEDGRGRCTSRETRTTWNTELRRAESYCDRHGRDR
jgi:hypothetical protein